MDGNASFCPARHDPKKLVGCASLSLGQIGIELESRDGSSQHLWLTSRDAARLREALGNALAADAANSSERVAEITREMLVRFDQGGIRRKPRSRVARALRRLARLSSARSPQTGGAR